MKWTYTIIGRNRFTPGGDTTYEGTCEAENIHAAIRKAFAEELWSLEEADSPTPDEFDQDPHPERIVVLSDDNEFFVTIHPDQP